MGFHLALFNIIVAYGMICRYCVQGWKKIVAESYGAPSTLFHKKFIILSIQFTRYNFLSFNMEKNNLNS